MFTYTQEQEFNNEMLGAQNLSAEQIEVAGLGKRDVAPFNMEHSYDKSLHAATQQSEIGNNDDVDLQQAELCLQQTA